MKLLNLRSSRTVHFHLRLTSSISGRLEKTTRSFRHHVAQHRPTGSETTLSYAPRSSRFGSEPPSVEDDVDVRRYAILELHARNDDDDLRLNITATAENCRVGTILCMQATTSLLPRVNCDVDVMWHIPPQNSRPFFEVSAMFGLSEILRHFCLWKSL